ncbi:MAG: NfeD family protein [Chloroflexota bacterium]
MAQYQKRARFWLSLLSTALQLAALAAVGLWVLPRFGVYLPWPLLLALGLGLVAYDIFTYVAGRRALEKEAVSGLDDMAGREGTVVSPLTPEGVVRVGGELWRARSLEGDVESGQVTVVGRDGLLLKVRALVENPRETP